MIISIASGKGGTGKTTFAVNLALSVDNVQFIDCDVEEPNSHIFLKPEIEEIKSVGVFIPEIDKSKCNFCGKCGKVCEYNAIVNLRNDVLIFYELCHGCGGCFLVCPLKAIKEGNKEIGIVRVGKFGCDNEFVDGILNTGEILTPTLIKELKGRIKKEKDVIIDCPPGTSCPVIESVKGSDFCILITEPTPFGLNDLILMVEVLKDLKIPFGVVINRYDIGDKEVENYCEEEKIRILMKIPFRRDISVFYSKGIPFVSFFTEYRIKLKELFYNLDR